MPARSETEPLTVWEVALSVRVTGAEYVVEAPLMTRVIDPQPLAASLQDSVNVGWLLYQPLLPSGATGLTLPVSAGGVVSTLPVQEYDVAALPAMSDTEAVTVCVLGLSVNEKGAA